MKLFILAVLALLTAAVGIRINTKVFVLRSGSDGAGVFQEYVTRLKESGNGQIQSSVDTKSVPENRVFRFPGFKIADRTFNGLPTTMSILVYENDTGSRFDDGVCRVTLTAMFSRKPTIIRCNPEDGDGRRIRNDIIIIIRTF